MIILPKELLEKLVTSEYLTMNDREHLINYIEMMEDYRIFYELFNILQERINKAIEYIKNDWYELNTRDIEHCANLGKDIRIVLLNILQGK